jgi:hypothetical protein
LKKRLIDFDPILFKQNKKLIHEYSDYQATRS